MVVALAGTPFQMVSPCDIVHVGGNRGMTLALPFSALCMLGISEFPGWGSQVLG